MHTSKSGLLSDYNFAHLLLVCDVHFIILDFIIIKYLATSTNYEASHQP